MLMRVALGIHCYNKDASYIMSEKEETERLQNAFETYDMMSRGLFTHASPTLFHTGTTHPKLSSCFLLQMSDDSINGIYDTLKRCAVISKVSSIKMDFQIACCPTWFSQVTFIFFYWGRNNDITSHIGCRGYRAFCA